MYRPGGAARALSLALLLAPTASAALEGQTSLRLGGGATTLVGQSEWDAGTGWLVVADAMATVGSPHVQVGFQGFYGAKRGGPGLANEWITGKRLVHYGVGWVAQVRTARPHRVSPYLQVGVGLTWGRLTLDYAPGNPGGTTSYEWANMYPGFHGAAGLDVPLGAVALWAEARYARVTSDDLAAPNHFALLGGLRFSLGRR